MNDEPIGEYDAINFDGLERRANYRTIAYREDMLHVFGRRDGAAIIYHIIYRWQTEVRRAEVLKEIERRKTARLPALTPEEVEDRMWVYMSYNDFVRESGQAVGYNTVIRMLHYLVHDIKVIEQRENHDPHYSDYEYRINKEVAKTLLKALPATPAFAPKVPKKKESTQMGTAEENDSTQTGIPDNQHEQSTHLGTDSTQEGIASTQMGTEVYPNGGTSQITTQNYSHNDNTEEESNSAHTDTFAPPHVGALSLSQSTDTESHSHHDSPIADSNTPPSEGDTDYVPVPAPGHPHRVGDAPSAGVGSHDAPLDDRQVAAPEARSVLEAGQEEIDALGRAWQSVDDEQTASREDVPVVAASPLPSSTVEPGESEKGTLPGAPVPETPPAQGQEGKRTGKRKTPRSAEEPPKSDTREVQKRIDTHRGYPLEEKVDIIRERQAVKAWCGLHTLEQYDVVMDEMKRDPYWGKSENYYRIGGLTLLRETSRILAKVERRQASNLRVVPPPEPVDKSKLFSMEHIVLPRKGASR